MPKTAFDYTTRNGSIFPRYRCGISAPSVDVYKHGPRFAITTLIGDFQKHTFTEKGNVKCARCASQVTILTD